MNMIETMHLTKEYSDFAAVSDINLHIRKGTVYGFLGPNGAGKSTTMKMFLGLTRPSSGSFTIDGMSHPGDRMKILREVGSFIEAPAFYGNLTGEENLDIIRKILGLPKSSVSDALELTGLTPYRKRLAKKYSLGMKQRLGIARAMLHNPDCLLLDEPINGLDPVGIQEVRDILLALAERGTAILISSHILSEMEQLAHRVGILAQGKIVEEFSPSMMRAQYGEDFEKYVIDIMRRKQV